MSYFNICKYVADSLSRPSILGQTTTDKYRAQRSRALITGLTTDIAPTFAPINGCRILRKIALFSSAAVLANIGRAPYRIWRRSATIAGKALSNFVPWLSWREDIVHHGRGWAYISDACHWRILDVGDIPR